MTDDNSNSDLETFKSLMDNGIIDCKMCKYYLTIPIRLVEGIGHVCNTCWNSDEFSNNTRKAIRDDALETMIKDAPLACRNQKFGCNVMGKYEDLINHQNTACSYAPKSCPLLSNCTWKGKIEEFLQHCLSHHQNYEIKIVGNKYTGVLNKTKSAHATGLLLSKDHAIKAEVEYKSVPNYLVITLSNILDEKTYEFKLRFVGKEGTLTVENCKVETLESMLGNTHSLSKTIKLTAFEDLMQSDEVNVLFKIKK